MKTQYIVILAVLLGLSWADRLCATENAWTRYQEKDGIQSYKRPVEGSKFWQFKGVTTVDAGIEVIGMVLRDIPAYDEWIDGCQHSELVDIPDENTIIAYYIQDTTWPVIHRDVVLQASIDIDWETPRFMVHTQAIEDPRIPPKEHLVRIQQMTSSWVVEYLERTHTQVTYTFWGDPGGTLLASLVNARSKHVPYKMLQGLQRMVKEPRYIEAAQKSQDRVMLEQFIKDGKFKQ